MASKAAAQNLSGHVEAAEERSRGREVLGIVLLGAAIFLGLSVASLQLGQGTLMGPLGASAGLGLYALVGVGAYLATAGLALVAVRWLTGQPIRIASVVTFAMALGTTSVAVLLHLGLGGFRLRGYAPGGLLGEYTAELMASVVGRAGTLLFALMGVAVSLVVATPLSMGQLVLRLGRALGAAGRAVAASLRSLVPARSEQVEEEELLDDEGIDPDHADTDREATQAPVIRSAEETLLLSTQREAARVEAEAEAAPARIDDTEVVLPETPKRARRAKRAAQPVVAPEPVEAAEQTQENEPVAESATDEAVEVLSDEPIAVEPAARPPIAVVPSTAAPSSAVAPRIVEAPPARAVEPRQAVDYIPANGGYHLPSIELLDEHPERQSDVDRAGRDEMLALADKLQRTLADYGVKGQVQEIHPGPVVTMYEFVPAAGTKLSKITGLANDLAMAMAALRVRIVAPIPGKSSVGIEVPNKTRATVYFREILADPEISKVRARLTMALGKDIAGAPVAVDLAKMPHLLVAGTTGSGKSVGINGMICSILFNATPEEVRMIMIDPKMVELSVYEGIPHLLLPVVTDPKKANLALRWAVEEMERRYELVSKAGVRDLVSYNKSIQKAAEAPPPPPPEPREIRIWVDDGTGRKQEIEVAATEAAVRAAGGVVDADVRDEISAAHAAHQAAMLAYEHQKSAAPPKKLPYIVVVIDEFADLMMVAPKDVETSVARIAQKARAVGIHLIVATQRPSVDVITGLIKANFPSRIGFQVASKIDSRTILDQQGAENLLGNGDMLFTDRGQALRRIHGAFVSDDEVKRLVQHLMKQGRPVYDLEILKPRDEDDEEGGAGGGDAEGGGSGDALYDQAVRIVCETRQASVSMIQRRLQIGFNRASRLVEKMERDGIVGAANGSKPREVLAQAI